jgi:hypothetical protein
MSSGQVVERPAMSEMGQSGKAQIEQMLSALPAIADIGQAFLNVRVVPEGDICSAAESTVIRSSR